MAYGAGSFDYLEGRSIPWRYRFYVKGIRRTVTGKTKAECLKKSKEKTAKILQEEKLTHPTSDKVVVLLQDAIIHWLEIYKKPKLKARSYDTLQALTDWVKNSSHKSYYF